MKRIRYAAKRYIFSGRYMVRNILAVMIVATVIALVVVVLSIPGTKNNGQRTTTGEVSDGEPTLADPDIPGETLVLNEVSMIQEINSEELSALIDEGQPRVSAKDVNALTNAMYDMTGRFLTEQQQVIIRKTASENAEIVGRLFAGGTGDVIETGDDWTKVSSDGVVGYVETKDILTGADATAKAADYKATFAVVKDRVRVREEGKPTGKVLFIANVGEFFTVDTEKSTDGWICARLVDGSYAYLTEDHVTLTEGMEEAVSVDDLVWLTDAKEEYKALLDMEARALEDPLTTTSHTDLSEITGSGSAVTRITTSEGVVTATTEDLYLLAAIVYAESGSESYAAQLAVANVVMNRLRSSYYPDTISEVIYQPYQFTACKTKTFANALSTGGSSESLRAAQEAMAGINNVGDCIGFKFPSAVNISKTKYHVQIDSIMFFY